MAARYCTIAQVQAVFRNLTITASSSITTAQLTEWIEEMDEEIDGRIGTRYIVPVVIGTSPKAIKILRTICLALVADRVRATLPNNQLPSSATDKKSIHPPAMTRMEANKKLDMVADGKLLLSDVQLISSNDGINDFSSDSGTEPFFSRGDGKNVPEPNQW